MSLSGQYLEELSRRYKKQVEELQQSFAKTLHHIEEQNRKNTDREQHLYEQNLQMRHDLNEVLETLQNWKNIVIYCGGIMFFLLFYFIIYIFQKCLRRSYSLSEENDQTLVATKKKKKSKGDLKRRKSIDGTVTHHVSPAIRRRRPSEEALKISGTYEDLLIAGGGDDVRNIGSGSDGTDFVEVCKVESSGTSSKKKKNKDKVRKTSTGSRVSKRSSSGDLPQNNGPAEYDIKNGNLIRCTNDNKPIEEIPYLEDNDEFIIPTASELSYNEYVPSMSSSQRINGLDSSISDTSSHRSSNTKLDKSRRLSSPAFFKTRSSLRKSLPPVVQSSGWEWYRFKKSKAKSESPDVISVGAGSNMSTSTPIDNSGNSDEMSNKSKKTGGSFRRMLKKVF